MLSPCCACVTDAGGAWRGVARRGVGQNEGIAYVNAHARLVDSRTVRCVAADGTVCDVLRTMARVRLTMAVSWHL
jgi:hypothetical protein